MHLDPLAGLRRPEGSARAADRRPSSVTKNPRVPAGPSSRGVTHETSASPAGKQRRRGLERESRSGRPAASVRRARLDREIGSTRPVLFAAVDKSVGEEPEREPLAGSRPFRAGVVEDQEAMAQAGHAGRDDARVDWIVLPAVADRGARRRPFARACRRCRERRGRDRHRRSTRRGRGAGGGGRSRRRAGRE